MASGSPKNVAIIGAGLAGLSLALSLHARSIRCTIYELRLPSKATAGALMLSPNALGVLDSLGVYERIRSKGYHFENIAFKNEREETTDHYPLGNEKLYGYKALRVYRQILLTELRAMVQELAIPLVYGKKFSHVLLESPDEGVTFQFEDGSTAQAALLVGADGIHSTVRKHVSPSTTPLYLGMLAITCAIPTSKLRFPADKDYSTLPVGIHGKHGIFVLAPQDVDGSEVLAGTQKRYPEQTKAEWSRLFAAKDELLALLSANKSDWPDVVQSGLENVQKDTLSIWPYYTVPKLAAWRSEKQRVIILGDAAHAIPPTAGQGASQAFEDAFTLAFLLSKMSPETSLAAVLDFWQNYRQERVDKVIAVTQKLNNSRLPVEQREKLGKDQIWRSEESGDMGWLYVPKIEEKLAAWVEGARE
jgi:2-polyprenyl-6-methoxyphenol hydroxylase-like FAD-dependent oxidoreductase